MSGIESAPAGRGLTPPRLRWFSAHGAPAAALGALAIYAIFRVVANLNLLASRSALVIDSLCFAAADLALVAYSYRAANTLRDDRDTRRAWRLITIASCITAFGSISWSLIQIAYAENQLPLWINLVFALGYTVSLSGLLSFPGAPRRRADRITFSFDIATVVLSGGMILWYWCVRTGAFVAQTTLMNQALVIGYPVADLALLVAAAILLVRSNEKRNRRVFGFFAFAYLCSAIGDFWYGFLAMEGKYERNTLLDVLWLGGIVYLIVAAASQLRRPAPANEQRSAGTIWMAEIPFIAVGLAFAMLFLALREGKEGVEVQLGVGALVMTILAIARQRISVREAARLMDERATRDARFRALVQHSSDVVMVLDVSLRASYVSPAIEGVLGLEAEEGVGRTFVELVALEDREQAAALLRRVAAIPSSTESLRCRMTHADGTLRTMETLASNLLADPAVEGIVLNSRDITQRMALEEQLQHTQKLDVVGRLAGGVAHDFNNLLLVIGANAEFVLSDGSDDEARREAAEEIKDATKRAAALTKQLLALSRRQEPRPVVIDANDVVRHVERMLCRVMQHTARVQIELAERPWPIEIDPGQLEQALLNLAVNARDAMPAGGLLSLRTRNLSIVERAPVDRGVLEPGRYVAITIEDTGAGMTADVRARIFEPFFTTKSIGSGTGLGLAMVLGVVQQAGGQIQVRSKRGEGTSITLYLPVAHTNPMPLVQRTQPSMLRGAGRILVVDDEEAVRTVIQRQLRRIGYEVDAAADAQAALAMLAVTPLHFDLVLSDILMPQKTGLELATEIIEAKVPVEIVLMTGFADNATVREATEIRRLKVLRKPFEMDQLAGIVEEALSRAHCPDGDV